MPDTTIYAKLVTLDRAWYILGMRALISVSCLVGLLLWAAPTSANDLSGELKDINWIGFQQFREASRVFVRTTEPVKYTIDNSRPNMVVLILENTRVPLRNNRRAIDTSFFDSPVRYIIPKVIEGPSASVRIEIYLRDKVPFQKVQNDNVLSIFFQRT